RQPEPKPGRTAEASRDLERNLPQREPPLQLLLHWQLLADLGLEPELVLGVPRLVPCRHERVVGAALEVVDEVERLAAVLEREHGAEQTVAVAAALEVARHDVERDNEVLELDVLQDDPAVAALVV